MSSRSAHPTKWNSLSIFLPSISKTQANKTRKTKDYYATCELLCGQSLPDQGLKITIPLRVHKPVSLDSSLEVAGCLKVGGKTAPGAEVVTQVVWSMQLLHNTDLHQVVQCVYRIWFPIYVPVPSHPHVRILPVPPSHLLNVWTPQAHGSLPRFKAGCYTAVHPVTESRINPCHRVWWNFLY